MMQWPWRRTGGLAPRSVLLWLAIVGLVACRWAGAAPPGRPRGDGHLTGAATRHPHFGNSAVVLEDRSPFRSGLRDSEAGVLEQLRGASIYHLDMEIAEDAMHLRGREEVRFTNQETTPFRKLCSVCSRISGGHR